MGDDGFDRLTEGQRACLWLIAAGHDSAEAARQLDISVYAVTERLRGARRILGASSSRQAARWLAEREQPEAYNSLVNRQIGVPSPLDSSSMPEQADDFLYPAAQGEEPKCAREDQSSFELFRAVGHPPFRIFHLWEGVLRNDLTVRQTIIVVAVLTGLILSATALMILAYVEITRLIFASANH